jgi:rare lipoprotein A (peptidoglycan hydrolase)
MAVINFLKKTTCWTAVLLCLLFIGKASVVHGSQSDGTIQSRDVKSIGDAGQKVTAGWYGPRHHKNVTANGQRFNMFKNTLAHKTLPFGTMVRLVTLDKKKYAIGVVNDRGPYIKGRDLDVSYALAKQLGFVRKGVVKLCISKIEDSDR